MTDTTDRDEQGSALPARLHADTQLTMAQAAIACGVSRDTIKRRLQDGRFPDAAQSGAQSAWMIPVHNLTAAGLLSTDRVAETLELIERSEIAKATATAREEVKRLEAEARHLREQLDMAMDQIAFLRSLVTRAA